MKKERVISLVNALPSEFETEILIEKLLFMEKVEAGLKQALDGKTIAHSKVVKQLRKRWQK